MAKRNKGKLNHLERILPEGLLVDAAWLGKKGYSTSLRSQYVSAGWLEQPARQVYRRPRGSLGWQQVVISLQTLLGRRLTVGGRTALELEGYSHYLPQRTREVHLYGPERPPVWLDHLRTGVRFSTTTAKNSSRPKSSHGPAKIWFRLRTALTAGIRTSARAPFLFSHGANGTGP